MTGLIGHQFRSYACEHAGERGYVVRHDGRLAPLEAGCDLGDVGWEPAVVVWCPVAKGQQLLVQVPPPAHLVKEAPTSIDPYPSPSSTHRQLTGGRELFLFIRTPLSCSLT
jgi:hypothetical protein